VHNRDAYDMNDMNVYHGSIECSYMFFINVFIYGLWDVISPLQPGDGRV